MNSNKYYQILFTLLLVCIQTLILNMFFAYFKNLYSAIAHHIAIMRKTVMRSTCYMSVICITQIYKYTIIVGARKSKNHFYSLWWDATHINLFFFFLIGRTPQLMCSLKYDIYNKKTCSHLSRFYRKLKNTPDYRISSRHKKSEMNPCSVGTLVNIWSVSSHPGCNGIHEFSFVTV